MIIGVDAGMLGIDDKRLQVGVWRVVVNVLTELRYIDQKNSYKLFSFLPIPQSVMQKLDPQMKNIVLTPAFGWMSWRVPLELRMHPVDVFIGFGQVLPNTKAKKIGVVYDVGFLSHPEAYPESYQRLKSQTQNLVKMADRIIVISDSVKKELLQTYQVSKTNIDTMHLGVSSVFTFRGEKHTEKHPYFLFVGSIKRGKNIPILLAGFANFLKGQQVPYDLVLAGSNYWQDPLISSTIRQYNLETRVKNIGFIDDEKLAEYYRGAVAFVSPSFVEGFCLPAAEALQSGIPVVVSDIPVMREIVGEHGIFVDPHNPRSISDGLQKAHNTKISPVQVYGWSDSAKKLLASINSL